MFRGLYRLLACAAGVTWYLHPLHIRLVDFLDFVFGTWHYWTFNLADSFILVGVVLYGLLLTTGFLLLAWISYRRKRFSRGEIL